MRSKINFSKFINFNTLLTKSKVKVGKLIKPLSFVLLITAVYKNKNFLKSNISYCDDNNSKKPLDEIARCILDPNKTFDNKYFTIEADLENEKNEETIIYILYNSKNPLQEELKEIINNKIKNYINKKNLLKNRIKVKIIESSQNINFLNELKQSFLDNYTIESENADNVINLIKKENRAEVENNKEMINNNNYILDKIDSIKNSNEPLVLIKSGFCLESLNALSFVKDERITKNKNEYTNKKISFGLNQKLDNLILYYYCDDMIELREHFKYLEKPENKIILLPVEGIKKNDSFEYDKLKVLSIYKDKNTKIIFINNSELSKNLRLEKNLMYVYYPPKIPNVMKNVELFLQENQLKQRYEGIDLNKLFNNSPMNFILKFNFFRDEIKLNHSVLNKAIEGGAYSNNNMNLNLNLNKTDRIKIQKLFSFPKKQVRQLATTDKSLFKKTWNESNKTVLYIWLPNWAFIKEKLFNYILYDANHLFDEIQITNSKAFTQKNHLYDYTGLADDLPQLFIIQTGDKEKNIEKKIYSFNYFRFSNELQNYMSNRHPLFKLQTPVDNYTKVNFINAKNFKEVILDDKKLKEFIIEIKHEGCPSCFMLGKMFDHLSLKFKKHKLENKIKFFRIDTENDLRYLGDFAATPTYVFGKKNAKGEITFLNEIPKQEFIFRVKKYSNYDLTKIRYHPNLYFGFQVYQNKLFLKPDYDPDMDISAYI